MTCALAFLRDMRGSAAVEMALMIPLLLILMFVGFEAGHYFYTEHKVIKSVREGARYGGRLPWGNFPCAGAPTGWSELADSTTKLRIQTVTLTGTTDGTMPRVPGMAKADISVRYRCDPSYAGKGIFKGTTGGAPILLVQASAGYSSLFEQLGFLDSSFHVQASAEAVVSGI